MSEPVVSSAKTMKLRYAGTCRNCGRALSAGVVAVYDRSAKNVYCVECPGEDVQVESAEVAGDADTVAAYAQGERYAGQCVECGKSLAAGTGSFYDLDRRAVTCLECAAGKRVSHFEESAVGETYAEPAQLQEAPVLSGKAGASAQREHDRRVDRREARIRSDHPLIGGLILAATEPPPSTTAWATGAVGEVVLGRRLDAIERPDVRVLHDRRIPGSRANIDHIVVCPSGVYVIDAKRYENQRPSLRVEGGFFSPRVETLMIGSRDGSKLVAGVRGQIAHVESVLLAAGLENVPIGGMLCFVDSEWPLFGAEFVVHGISVLWPTKAAKHLVQPGPLGSETVDRVHRLLASSFLPA